MIFGIMLVILRMFGGWDLIRDKGGDSINLRDGGKQYGLKDLE